MSVVYVYPKCPAGNSEGHWLSALHRFASVFSKFVLVTSGALLSKAGLAIRGHKQEHAPHSIATCVLPSSIDRRKSDAC
jgi:hypothetical protein